MCWFNFFQNYFLKESDVGSVQKYTSGGPEQGVYLGPHTHR
jgi:hypothetical protein